MRANTRLAALFDGDFESFIQVAMRKVFQGKTAHGHFRACGYGTEEINWASSSGSDSNNSSSLDSDSSSGIDSE